MPDSGPAWLYEAGIGEARAALVDDDQIVEAAIELDTEALKVGLVARARLVELLPGRRGRVTLDGGEALINHLPPGITQGASLTVEIVREALPEAGRAKLAKAVPSDLPPCAAPTLYERLMATGLPVRSPFAHEPDALEAAGWSELLDEAVSGEIVFPLGALRLSPTPAMTLFDVDGAPPLDALAVAAAHAVARAIRRHGIGGSIGIDFPTIAGKAQRNAVAMAIDESLPQPFERTAMNGFGFLQIVRPRPRASIPEILRADPVAAAARAALRTLERTPPTASRRHTLPAAVHARLMTRPDWLTELARRTGVVHELESAR
ncbi:MULTISPECIES: ribonuclease [unclassified Sphingomonas]|uniref:ribonuclease n=1 Tax=unclassified Sphingomonas TaxID=196159 RepID=UPI0006F35E54|nr:MULTISPECIES: ribonuclease [unclassified Sphingomonas]KQS49686.1 ribonuclease [Sphingomonas sp. Leaf198]